MDNKFKNVCKNTIEEAIIKIGNIPEYENYTLCDIKRGLAEILKDYIKNNDKNISLERNSNMFDSNNNIMVFTNDYNKESENKDNNEYICALIPNSCFITHTNYQEAMRLKYLLNKNDYFNLKNEQQLCERLTIGNKEFNYFTSSVSRHATLFKESEIEDISNCLFNDEEYYMYYTLVKLDVNVFSKESILNDGWILYEVNNNVNGKNYLTHMDNDMDIAIFYDAFLLKCNDLKLTSNRKEAKIFPFDNALLLLVALNKAPPETKWKIEKY